MPRLSEPGPLGTRAEHWHDFGSLAGNSNLFVHVVAHIAAAAVLHSGLQYQKAGQITPLAKPTGGHRPLLMMSFLRRLALKSVMAAQKESVAKCAGPLQYGVGRPDGANTMIKTIQYLAEADVSRVLVALDLKAAFQNVSRRSMLYSIAQTDADLAAVFSTWYTGTTEHRMHYDSAYTKISANSGVDQGCSLSACGFSAVVDPVLRSVMAQLCTLYDSGAKLFAYYLDATGICGSNRSIYCRQSLASLQPPDQSTLLYSPPRYKYGKALARTSSHLNSKTKSHSPSAAWVDIYKSMETLSPALLFWVSRPPWRKQHNAFRRLLPHLQTLTLRDSMCRK